MRYSNARLAYKAVVFSLLITISLVGVGHQMFAGQPRLTALTSTLP